MYKRRMGDVLSFTEAKEERDRVMPELQRVQRRIEEHIAAHGTVSASVASSLLTVVQMLPYWSRHEYPTYAALKLIHILEIHLLENILAAT